MMRDGGLIDGRNRLAACKLASVKPIFAELSKDQDEVAFIVAANLDRRDMTKGQKAMVLAMLYPEPEKGGRGKNQETRKAVVSTGFSPERLKQARAVLHHSRALAESVVKGITPLDAALATVRQEQQYANGSYVTSLNGERRDLTTSQRACIAVEMLPLIEQEAAKRQKATQAKPGEKAGRKATQKVGEPSSLDRHQGESAAEAAAITGTNRQYVADAKKMKEEERELWNRRSFECTRTVLTASSLKSASWARFRTVTVFEKALQDHSSAGCVSNRRARWSLLRMSGSAVHVQRRRRLSETLAAAERREAEERRTTARSARTAAECSYAIEPLATAP